MAKDEEQKESCSHPKAYWQEWKYVDGVTSGIQFRTKYCPDCQQIIDSESRST